MNKQYTCTSVFRTHTKVYINGQMVSINVQKSKYSKAATLELGKELWVY